MKTTFSSGVIVTSQWLNGAQNIYFDGQDLDWHYSPLGLNSLITTGPNGLDSRYITLGTSQPNLNSSGLYSGGTPISGTKVVTGVWNFGYNPEAPENPVNTYANAPKSFTTNDKYNYANDISSPSVPQKYGALSDEDLVTKLVLTDQLNYLLENGIDNGVYYSASNPACTNYSIFGTSTTICPN
jgi:hypothetical protein